MEIKLLVLWLMAGLVLGGGVFFSVKSEALENQAVVVAQSEPIKVYPSLPLIEMAAVPVLREEIEKKDVFEQEAGVGFQSLARSGYVLDLDSGTVLWTQNETLQLPPASALKMMTAIVARENYGLETVLTVQGRDITSSNTLGTEVGQQFKVRDWLASLLVSSSNEAGQVLANNYPGGQERFVAKMNAKARELGLEDSYFISPEGFDYVGQVMTARDLAILGKAVLEDEFLMSLVNKAEMEIKTTDGRSYFISNTNLFITEAERVLSEYREEALFDCSEEEGAERWRESRGGEVREEVKLGKSCEPRFYGLKTGTTGGAGEVLVSVVEVQGHRLLAVVMGSRQRYRDTAQILNWVLTNYSWQGSWFGV